MSFFVMTARRMAEGTQTMQLHDLIDWADISHKLKGLYKRETTNGGGPEPYAPLSMFKLMLLGQWHGLSDTELEHALRQRMDFIVFTDLQPDAGPLPDSTTICRFRNRLVNAKLDQVLLRRINAHLERYGLKVAGSRGAIIDATIIPSAARPNGYVDMDDEGEPQIKPSADPDATWVKKGKEAHLGYRGYAVADSEDGYIEHVQAHPANETDVSKLPEIVDTLIASTGQVPEAVLADKGYASSANSAYLQAQGIGDLIQQKGSRGKPLHPLRSMMNAVIGTLRYKVEQGFGTMKRQFHLARARYFGTAKVQAQMIWAAMGMSRLKAHRKLQRQMATADSSPS